MNTVVPISRDDERLEAASRWILNLDEGLSAEQEIALRTWLAQHPMNPVELVEVARAWDKLDGLSRLADVFPIEPAAKHARPARRSWAWRPPTAAVYAASVIVLAAIAWYASPQWYAGEEPPQQLEAGGRAATYETIIGEQRVVALVDGTVVTLNTDSRIRVAYSDTARLLHLVRGQIHVDVAPDPARPLSIIAADRIVQAVGTAFSVALTGSRQVELVVTEGQVLIGVQPEIDPEQSALERGLREASGTRTISAGQEMIVRGSGELIVPISPEDIEVKLAWRDGRLIFRDEPLEQAIAEIERYTTVEFVFMDENLKQQTISGRYKTGDIESLLLALRANFDIAYEYDGRDRVLLRSL